MAAAPSGTVIAVVQSAQIDGETGKLVLQPEAPVFSGDKIETGSVGEAQIIFRDKTKLVVGPNSLMVIDAFVFDDNDNAREITLDAAKGVFRFFTGTSRKDAYTINTPTATIGVRGTEFDVAVEKEGTTRVANFEGMTRICRRGEAQIDGKNCVETKDPCTLSVARPTEPNVISYSNKDIEFRNRQLKYYFRYIRNQSGLRQDFQVDLKQCKFAELIPLAPGGGPPSTPPDQPPPDEIPTPLQRDDTIIKPPPQPVDRLDLPDDPQRPQH